MLHSIKPNPNGKFDLSIRTPSQYAVNQAVTRNPKCRNFLMFFIIKISIVYKATQLYFCRHLNNIGQKHPIKIKHNTFKHINNH